MAWKTHSDRKGWYEKTGRDKFMKCGKIFIIDGE